MSATYGDQRYCALHGGYVGLTCPGCSGVGQARQLPLDPTPVLLRIASALERIAEQLERREP